MADALVDYYKILEVKKDSNENEIKKNYYKLAKKWHPDKNPDDQQKAEIKFKEIQKAYEILSDEQKRRELDSKLDALNEELKRPKSTATRNKTEYTVYFEDEDEEVENKPKVFSWYKNLSKSSKSKQHHERPKWNNNWAYEAYTDQVFEEAQIPSYKVYTGPTDTQYYEIYEAFKMYSLFKDMSSQMYMEHDDDEYLINLASLLLQQEEPEIVKLPKVERTNKQQASVPKWEFEWLGTTPQQASQKDSYYEDFDDSEYIFNEYYLLKCEFCGKQLDNEENLIKHESVCKRLSHNSSYKNKNAYSKSQNLTATCPICKENMDAYDFINHDCTIRKTTQQKKASLRPSKSSSSYDKKNQHPQHHHQSDEFLKNKFKSTSFPKSKSNLTSLRRDKAPSGINLKS